MVAIWQTIFSNSFSSNCCLLIRISQKFLLPKCLMDSKSRLVQIMSWRRTGDKPSVYFRIYASLGVDELTLWSIGVERKLFSTQTIEPIIGSDNGSNKEIMPSLVQIMVRRRTGGAVSLLKVQLGTNFSDIWIKIQHFFCEKMNIVSAKFQWVFK